MTREWFTMYCQNAAANVLDKDDKVRFTYEQLSAALNDPEHRLTDSVNTLHENIVQLCNNRCLHAEGANQAALKLTLLNIHAAYLMITGAWKEEPVQSGGTDEYGFEIF